MIIDAHQHFWYASYEGGDQGPGSRSRSYLPRHLKPILKEHKIEKTIAVQASPTLEENRFLLNLAETREDILGVVGWLDLEEAHAEMKWEEYKEDPHFLGIRPMIQNLPSDWLLKDTVLCNLKTLADIGLPIDLQANPRHLSVIIELLKRVPHMRGVIDHIAKPSTRQGEAWAENMEKIAEYPNIMCKVSGLVPEKVGANWTTKDILPYVELVLEAFGPKRIMFGSDWPVCLKSASYTNVIQLFEETVGSHLSNSEREAVYYKNACSFYQDWKTKYGAVNKQV